MRETTWKRRNTAMANEEKKNDKRKLLRGLKTKYFFLCLGGFLSSVLPLLALLLIKWEEYTDVPGGAVRLCFGGVAIAVLVALKVMGKLKLPSRIAVMAIALVMVYLLEAMLADLTLILWVALCGESVDTFLFSPFAKRMKEKISIAKQADATADRVEELLKQYVKG